MNDGQPQGMCVVMIIRAGTDVVSLDMEELMHYIPNECHMMQNEKSIAMIDLQI